MVCGRKRKPGRLSRQNYGKTKKGPFVCKQRAPFEYSAAVYCFINRVCEVCVLPVTFM